MYAKFIIIILFSFTILKAQTNSMTMDDRTGKPMLIGLIERSAFTDSAFADWFDVEYENYSINENFLKNSEDLLKKCQISIVLGTWCPDSRREVPRFFKILDFLNFPQEKVTIIAVNRDKEDPERLSEDLSIDFVPTFILINSGEEIGRIIETPVETLEEDLSSLLVRIE